MFYLIGPIHKLGRKGIVMNTEPGLIFTTLLYLLNLQRGPVNYSVTLNKDGKGCQGQTLYLIGPIHNIGRKGSVANMAVGAL